MDKIEVFGFKRSSVGKKGCDKLRDEANVPGVLYGKDVHELFYVPMRLMRDLVYTSDVHFIDFNLEGIHYDCILQDIQFHPVSDVMRHIDFYVISNDKKITMMIPVESTGTAIGSKKGGILVQKAKKLQVTAYPQDMPDKILVDVSNLDCGGMIRVRNLEVKNCTFNVIPAYPLFGIKQVKADTNAKVV